MKAGDAKPWVYRHARGDYDYQVTENTKGTLFGIIRLAPSKPSFLFGSIYAVSGRFQDIFRDVAPTQKEQTRFRAFEAKYYN